MSAAGLAVGGLVQLPGGGDPFIPKPRSLPRVRRTASSLVDLKGVPHPSENLWHGSFSRESLLWGVCVWGASLSLWESEQAAFFR